jgi:uncharacterized phiE125 gp8 family phage protein
MGLSLVTAPALEPVTLAELKAHCRIDVGDEDALISALGKAAREHVETLTHRPLITQTWDLTLDAFPCGVLELPLPPVSSVTSISYIDQAGDTQTWDAALYRVDLPSGPFAGPARIQPIYGGTYPITQAVTNAVTVRFVCGFGSTALSVPASLRHAIKLLVAHWYDTGRGPVQIGNIVQSIPLTVDALTWSFKHFV